jgi:hypothetical protein
MLAGDDELSSYCRVDVLERTYRNGVKLVLALVLVPSHLARGCVMNAGA